MSHFKTIRCENGNGQQYEVDLALNDVAIMNDHLEIVVMGRYRESEDQMWQSEDFVVRLDPIENKLYVLYYQEKIEEIDLSAFDGALEEDLTDPDARSAWEQICDLLTDNGNTIEEVIQNIPAIDPVFGCLIKAGLSTAIGQTIECYSEVRHLDQVRQQLWKTLRCLGVNKLVVASKFTLRTLRCTVSAGWDVV